MDSDLAGEGGMSPAFVEAAEYDAEAGEWRIEFARRAEFGGPTESAGGLMQRQTTSQRHLAAVTAHPGHDYRIGQRQRGGSARSTWQRTTFGGSLHKGTLRNDRAPQFMLDGSGRWPAAPAVRDAGVTIDGVDISAHAADINAHHAKLHAITDAGESQRHRQPVSDCGLTAVNTLGLLAIGQSSPTPTSRQDRQFVGGDAGGSDRDKDLLCDGLSRLWHRRYV